MKVSLLSLLALVLLVAVPSAWAAGNACTTDSDCASGELCSALGSSRACVVRGGLGSVCDATTTCGEHLKCQQGFCTFDDTSANNTDTMTIPADGHCDLFDFQHQCIKEYFCNPLSGTCESATVRSCTVTDLASPGTGCKPTQWCTPINETNTAAGAPGACITITAADNSTNVCNPACPTGQTCALGICINDNVGNQCSPACPAGKTCLGNVCTDDTTGLQCKVTADCPTGRSCVAGVCIVDVGTCPTEGCGAGKSCVAGVCVTDAGTCPAAGCGTGMSCVAGVCVTDAPTCPAAGCGAGKTCIAGVCVTDTATCPTPCATGQTCVAGACVATPTACPAAGCAAGTTCIANVCVANSNTCPATGCGVGKSCVAGVCVADAVVPATCAADKPCSGTDTCVNGVCTPATGAQNVCSPACATGTTCVNSVCVANSAFTGTLGSRCDTTHGCNANLACFAGFCVPSNLAAQAGGASVVHATVSILASLAITCVAALMTV